MLLSLSEWVTPLIKRGHSFTVTVFGLLLENSQSVKASFLQETPNCEISIHVQSSISFISKRHKVFPWLGPPWNSSNFSSPCFHLSWSVVFFFFLVLTGCWSTNPHNLNKLECGRINCQYQSHKGFVENWDLLLILLTLGSHHTLPFIHIIFSIHNFYTCNALFVTRQVLLHVNWKKNCVFFFFFATIEVLNDSSPPQCWSFKSLTCPGVFPVCQRAFRKCSPVPVVEFTTLSDTPE